MKINQWTRENTADLYRQSATAQATGAAITEQARSQLIAACRAAYPNEACGVLAYAEQHAHHINPGNNSEHTSQGNSIVQVNTIYPIRNAAADSARCFLFHPQDWISTYYAIQKNRQSLVGFYHSHPGSLPIPSAADYTGIQYSTAASYWIISLNNPHIPVVQPYLFNQDTSSFEPLVLAQVSI
ncbi:hypothetical protein PAECIP111893_02259 [Paenibacillus plantiphilus]|uniref:JAB domain-containing protein n=1 Tax=Paenibacillus plantiphilus TaxID=2905650 RepID=A0ABM9C752_9BACL|nr:M67 family metallopeptidase [Paenibacillus plantiphilus]CAH1204472.1 hypothetical protein PAECIP111893_02259 [Paenibacillus plantiphilus]